MMDYRTILTRAGFEPVAMSPSDPLIVAAEAAVLAAERDDADRIEAYLPPNHTTFERGLALGLAIGIRGTRA